MFALISTHRVFFLHRETQSLKENYPHVKETFWVNLQKLNFNVFCSFETWLGRITLKDTVPAFDLKVGSKTTTVYVHELSEGTLWIKAEPDFDTSRVALWATYVMNSEGSCAYIVTNKLSVSAPDGNLFSKCAFNRFYSLQSSVDSGTTKVFQRIAPFPQKSLQAAAVYRGFCGYV